MIQNATQEVKREEHKTEVKKKNREKDNKFQSIFNRSPGRRQWERLYS